MSGSERPNAPATSAVAGAGDLLAEHVEAVFLEFLGREASEQDVAVWMGVGSLRALIDGVLASEEYTSRVAKRAVAAGAEGLFVNCWTPELDRFNRPLGTISADGVAVVGRDGHLFLYGGSNDNLAMYRGEIAMAPDWLEQWSVLVAERVEHARETGRSICCLVVPDKLAVYGDLFPQPLDTGGPRPVVRLLEEARLPLRYPSELLHGARKQADTYMLTDSHLTGLGNRLLAETTIEGLDASPSLLRGVVRGGEEQLSSGDLGRHYAPPIVEVGERPAAPSAASIVFDNWPQVAAAGGHIGTLRIFRREDAPDPRTVVVFGDSYGFGDEAYRGLSWYLAQAFREVHFVWVPFGWDPAYLDRVGAELAVCQTAERFIARLPRRSVDVRALVEESAGKGGALGLEKVFGDVSAA
jgi:alginate O-acetyltransferase complex protein AlgJ